MEKTLLNTKWLGALSVAVVAFIFSFMVKNYAINAISAFMPTVVTEAAQFLPITIKNGAITEPKNALISKNYGNEQNPIMVVLDTRTDELSAENLKDQGVYISRKFFYGVSTEKTEIRSLSLLSDMTIDQQMLVQAAAWLEQYSGGYIFVTCFIALLIYFGCAILLYAALAHLIVGMAMKVGFSRTLRVTTLGYLALFIISSYTVSISFIITLVVLLGVNYLTAKYVPQQTADAA